MTMAKERKVMSIGSLNCRGIASDRIKRRGIFNTMREKHDICILLETHSTKEIERYWLSEWGYKGWFASYKSNSRGVAILVQNTFDFEYHDSIHDTEGRFCILDVSIRKTRFTIVAVYGPNQDEPNFFQKLQEHIESIDNDNIIAVGDWNVVLDFNKDAKNYINRNNTRANKQIIEMIRELDLIDIWREKFPDENKFTWFGPHKKMARLDYFLISSHLTQNIKSCRINSGVSSDHSRIDLQINLTEQEKGRGFWKFNNSLLGDVEYIKIVQECIKEVINQYKVGDIEIEEDQNINLDNIEFTINDQLLFDTLKLMIRGKTIPYCAKKKRERQQKETELREKLERVENLYQSNPTDCTLESLENTKAQLRQLIDLKAKGSIVRAKARWLAEGEKCTKYFYNLEKRHYLDKTITKLIVGNDDEITDIKEILKHQKEFYEGLYKSRKCNITSENKKQFFNKDNPHLNFLTKDESQQCEGKLQKAECLTALNNMKNNKSPGSDGFTCEFFKFFWKDLGALLVRSINFSHEVGQLSIMQRLGIITSIPKENKNRNYVQNWRPISLLNVDYKIASTVIANRIKKVINNLISDTQKGFLKNRYIGECTRLTFDLIQTTEEDNIPGLLLLLDFEKAFDSVDKNFMLETLKFFGFGPDLCHWIKTFYNNITSSVINYGHISESFQIERGVRQGDPLSPYLFILVAECMSAAIKWSPNIKGVKIDNSEYLISQYADDTTLYLDGSGDSVEAAMDIIDKFGKCAGLKINTDKTEAIWIGSMRNCREPLNLSRSLKWNFEGSFKILGIKYDLKKQDFTGDNFYDYLEKIKKLLNNWSFRGITTIGKILVIKGLAISKLVHLFMTLPDPSETFFKDLESVIYKFLWGKSKDKIKRSIIINTIENGGLNALHVKSFAKALKTIWIKKLMNFDISPWKILFTRKTEHIGGNLLWSYDPKEREYLLRYFNNFWKSVINGWMDALPPLDKEPKASDVLRQTLWFNSRIKINKKSLFYDEWYNSGICFLNDLMDEHGGFLSFDKFKSLYDINVNFLQYHGIISAIPRKWRNIIRLNSPLETTESPMLRIVKGLGKPCKYIYGVLVEKFATKPVKVQNKWKKEVPEMDLEWSDIYTLTKKVTRDTKLILFQYQIISRYLTTNSKLWYFKIRNDNRCTFCKTEKEDISHLFWECVKVQEIYENILRWLQCEYNFKMKITKQAILIGVFPVNENKIENILVLLLKRCIYINRCQNKVLNITSVKEFIKNYIQIEKEADYTKWYNKWGQLGLKMLNIMV